MQVEAEAGKAAAGLGAQYWSMPPISGTRDALSSLRGSECGQPSIMTCQAHFWLRPSAMIRRLVSIAPPAAASEMIRTGLSG
jgi:hypothetical protein